jgi:hypothetical protein
MPPAGWPVLEQGSQRRRQGADKVDERAEFRVGPDSHDDQHRDDDCACTYHPPPARPQEERASSNKEKQPGDQPEDTERRRDWLCQLGELGETEGLGKAEQMYQAVQDENDREDERHQYSLRFVGRSGPIEILAHTHTGIG